MASNEPREKRSGFKPREVEEVIDYYFHRPLAAQLVKLLLPLPISPDQVTLMSAAVGLLAGVVMALAAWHSLWWVTVGGFVLLLSILLDCADGQLARIRGQSSPVGRILDGTMDVAAPTSVLLGFAVVLVARGGTFEYVVPVGFAAACSLVLHTSQYDGVKNLYLHCARPDFSLGGKTLLSLEDIDEFERQFRAQRDWGRVLLMKIWHGWIGSQQRTFAAWAELSPRNEEERQLYIRIFFGYMRWWSWLGLGLHLFMLTVACWLTPLYLQAVWIAWFIMLVPLNLLHGWLVWRRPRLERRFAAELAELRAKGAPPSGSAPPVTPS
jgi:hypothetical protein